MGLDDLLWLRKGGNVTRYHTHPTLTNQQVNSHSFNVALILLHLNPSSSFNLIKAAMFHDLAEQDTGDSPAHAKWRNPMVYGLLAGLETDIMAEHGIKVALTPDEENWLKLADTLEYCLYSLEERRMGNRNMDIVFSRGIERMTGYAAFVDNENVREFVGALTAAYLASGGEVSFVNVKATGKQ